MASAIGGMASRHKPCMESALCAVWNPPSAVWHQGASLVWNLRSAQYGIREAVWHQGASLVWNPCSARYGICAMRSIESAHRAASFPVILSLSKFCERGASKTEEQRDEGISPVPPLGIMKTNVKSAQRAVYHQGASLVYHQHVSVVYHQPHRGCISSAL